MSKIFGFDEESYRRVQEATRRMLGTPRKGSQRRRQVPVLSGGGTGGGGGGDEFANCGCGDCIESGAIEDCTAIGEAPSSFKIGLGEGLAEFFGDEVVLTWVSDCTWESDLFEGVDIGDGSHDYKFTLTFTGKGIEEAELTLEDET